MVPLLRLGPSVPCVRFVAEGLLVHALHTLYADKIRPTLSEVRGAQRGAGFRGRATSIASGEKHMKPRST